MELDRLGEALALDGLWSTHRVDAGRPDSVIRACLSGRASACVPACVRACVRARHQFRCLNPQGFGNEEQLFLNTSTSRPGMVCARGFAGASACTCSLMFSQLDIARRPACALGRAGACGGECAERHPHSFEVSKFVLPPRLYRKPPHTSSTYRLFLLPHLPTLSPPPAVSTSTCSFEVSACAPPPHVCSLSNAST